MTSLTDRQQAKILCVGTGRDGTFALSRMIKDVFDRTDGRCVRHEYVARPFYQAYSEYAETGNEAFAHEIRQLIDQCPFDCIVGNGYAAILPFFREQWGQNTKLIHIRRTDRDACIASLIKNCEAFPEGYRYYSADGLATVKRMAAFHFGEMTREAWEKLSIEQKFGWYYDKTHALIDQHRDLFADCLELTTEKLNDLDSRRSLARMLTGSDTTVPPPMRLNAHVFDIASIAAEQRAKAMWLIGQADWQKLVENDAYGIEYFLEKFLLSMDAQLKRAPLGAMPQRSKAEMAALLSKVRAVLEKALKDVEIFESRNRDIGG